jgi:oxygen-independent coproporphyrinogen III oxidase
MPTITAPLPRHAPMGIYIHIPFCSHICPYCDFTTYAGKESLIPRFVRALETDLARQAARVGGREIISVFIGGGTPSLLDGDQVGRILRACRAHYRLAGSCEVSIETNPNSLDLEKLTAYRKAGVNRLSIGAQTLDRRGLRRLGRQHEGGDVLAALANAHAAGFERIGVDAIFGWPGQTLDSWRSDLDQLLALPTPPNHLSLYSLIVEPGTPFADMQARGILPIPDDDATADMYELAVGRLRQVGWTQYEIANWSRDPDHVSRHNALYWQHGDYLGVGAGAHGHLDGVRTINHLLPERWLAAVEAAEPTVSNTEAIDEATSVTETLLMGLRLLESGISLPAFESRHGFSLQQAGGEELDRLADVGLIEVTERRLRLTDRGAMLANDVIVRLSDAVGNTARRGSVIQ